MYLFYLSVRSDGAGSSLHWCCTARSEVVRCSWGHVHSLEGAGVVVGDPRHVGAVDGATVASERNNIFRLEEGGGMRKTAGRIRESLHRGTLRLPPKVTESGRSRLDIEV